MFVLCLYNITFTLILCLGNPRVNLSFNEEQNVISVFRCEYILDCKGEPKPFSVENQETVVKTVIEPMAGDGLRTICIAYKDYRKGDLSTAILQKIITVSLLNLDLPTFSSLNCCSCCRY